MIRAGDVFIADTYNSVIREIAAGTNVIQTIAGSANTTGTAGNGGQATGELLDEPQGLAVDSSGDLLIADTNNREIREINAVTKVISLVAGGGTQSPGNGGPATAASLIFPSAVAVDASGNVFFSDFFANLVREVSVASKVITTIAGANYAIVTGDGGPATAAQLDSPVAEATDAAGDVFIVDENDNVIREINHATGLITTIAGNGALGFSGDGGPATAARFFNPDGIAVNAAGDVFIADSGNFRIREINHLTHVITTIAGTNTYGYNGDNILATAAELDSPSGLALDSAGNLFIADYYEDRIREISAATGIITTVAGNGSGGFFGDGGQATAAELRGPSSIAVDAAGDLFIADAANVRVREVNHATGIISTVAGNGTQGFTGDGGQATAAETNPTGVAVDASGDLLIADGYNQRIREVNAASRTITTMAGGNHFGPLGNGGPATAAVFDLPQGLSLDASGDVLVADELNNEVRELVGPLTISVNRATPTVTVGDSGGTYTGAPYSATATVNESSSLENVSPTVTFYSGSTPTGTPLSGAPANAGTYTVVASFVGSTDYASTQSTPVTFTISPAPLTVTPNNATKVYGVAPPTFTASYSGFVGSDTAASLTTQPSFSTTATAASHVAGNPYAITASGAVDPNYTISFSPGSLTVTPSPLTVYANNQWMQVGTAVPTLSASCSGFVNGDTSASLTMQPTLSTTATSSSTVGGSPYSITASGAIDPDYSFTYVPGFMTVTTLPVPTVTVSDGGTYNASAYVGTGRVNGGTTLEGVGLTYTYYTGAAAVGTPLSSAPTNVGTYTVVVSFAGSADYSATKSAPYAFTINQAAAHCHRQQPVEGLRSCTTHVDWHPYWCGCRGRNHRKLFNHGNRKQPCPQRRLSHHRNP